MLELLWLFYGFGGMHVHGLASASDVVSTVVGSANAAASPRSENAPRREISFSLMLACILPRRGGSR